MAFGDVGGAITELIVTCRTPASGAVAIAKGDAVKLVGDYEVTNATDAEDPIFGQAMADADQIGVPIPVKVRGVAIFTYSGAAPVVDGAQGVLGADTDGQVKAPLSGNGVGVNVKVDTAATEVHVLL